MRTFARIPDRIRLAALGAAIFSSTAGGLATSAAAETYAGEKVAIGNGTAQVIVETNAAGAPSSIAVSLSPEALDGLPTDLEEHSMDGRFILHVPAEATSFGYRLVMVNWNPHGHPPPGIYTVPHFDFHFYTIDRAEVETISFTGPADPAAMVSDATLIAADYKVNPSTAINMMGVHAGDVAAPEFSGKPFTATFIYGYYKDTLIFLEPMVTHAFLTSKPDETMPVKTPARYSMPGAYPKTYSVRYDAGSNTYRIELGGLKVWQ